MAKEESLRKLFYKDRAAYQSEYQRRFSDPQSLHLDLEISGHPAFFCQTVSIYQEIVSILRINAQIDRLCYMLPKVALKQYRRRCLVDEIMLTNNIEGVRSTRREIESTLEDLKKKDKRGRFYGLVKKYQMLTDGGEIPLCTCADIRKIYDDIFYEEIEKADVMQLPDGEFFRKESVNVCTATDKVVHRGVMPESKINAMMEKSLDFLQDERIEILFRTAIFHYLFGYIHPFYDGNGRMSRLISSYMLSRTLNPLLGYRISYTVKDHIREYYDAFTICNDPHSLGELTPFVEMFLKLVRISSDQLYESLAGKKERLDFYAKSLDTLPYIEQKKMRDLYFILIQAELFSDIGVSVSSLMYHLEISENSLRQKLNLIPESLLQVNKKDRQYYYQLNLSAFDQLLS